MAAPPRGWRSGAQTRSHLHSCLGSSTLAHVRYKSFSWDTGYKILHMGDVRMCSLQEHQDAVGSKCVPGAPLAKVPKPVTGALLLCGGTPAGGGAAGLSHALKALPPGAAVRDAAAEPALEEG